METSQIGEVSIIEIIKKIKSGKYIVLAFFILGLLFSFWFSVFYPKTYQASTTIQMGVINGRTTEPPIQTAEKIRSGFFGKVQGLNAAFVQGTNLIKVSVSSRSQESAKEMLKDVTDKVLAEQNGFIDAEKAAMESRIKENEGTKYYLYSMGSQIEVFPLEFQKMDDIIAGIRPTNIIGDFAVTSRKAGLKVSLVFGGVLGLIIGVGVIFCRDWWLEIRGKI